MMQIGDKYNAILLLQNVFYCNKQINTLVLAGLGICAGGGGEGRGGRRRFSDLDWSGCAAGSSGPIPMFSNNFSKNSYPC